MTHLKMIYTLLLMYLHLYICINTHTHTHTQIFTGLYSTFSMGFTPSNTGGRMGIILHGSGCDIISPSSPNHFLKQPNISTNRIL